MMKSTQRAASSPAALEAGLRLGRLTKDEADIREAITEAVAECRTLGLSWAQIGLMLGTSREAAWQRYGREAKREAWWKENRPDG